MEMEEIRSNAVNLTIEVDPELKQVKNIPKGHQGSFIILEGWRGGSVVKKAC